MAGGHLTARSVVAAALLLAATLSLPRDGWADGLEPLPALRIADGSVTVSGVSSGGFFAQQLQVAYSATIGGVGIAAAGPYFCAGGGFPWNLPRALNICADFSDGMPFLGPPALARSLAAVRQFAADGVIDSLDHLRSTRVFLISGTNDTKVPAGVVAVAEAFYRAFVEDGETRVAREFALPAAHAWITADFGHACTISAPPFLSDCDFDSAGAILAHLYGALAPPTPAADRLIAFDQRPFFGGDPAAGLADTGYAYIPQRCVDGMPCRLHVALHGCQQAALQIGMAFVRHAGFNGWADANDIVVLYPQTAPLQTRWFGVPLPWPNPQACWDWWGFTGRDFATQRGRQPKAVKAMIDRLAGGTLPPLP